MAEGEAERLVQAGAEAVVLVGSYAYGTADDASDVDLVAIGNGPAHETNCCGGRLLVINWRTAAETRSAFAAPDLAGVAVPAWRNAHVLQDPDGVAARLRDEALNWEWTAELHDACDRWVADRLLYLAEDLLRMAGCMRRGPLALAAASAPYVVVQVTNMMAVHRRLELRSVNDKWAETARSEGVRWTALRERALGLTAEVLPVRLKATVELYRETAELVRPVLDERQRATATATASQALEMLYGLSR
jgi:Nucleotidyltransferase domain